MLNRLSFKLLLLLLLFAGVLGSFNQTYAQCPAGYNQAQVNWDNLDYYWNSGGSGNTPYNGYISNANEQAQKFAIGKTYLTITTSNSGLVNPGAGNSAENGTHTGNITNYTGDDVQYDPSANGQSITITFASPVSAPNFTLYDIDGGAQFTVTATNNLNLATAVSVTTYASTILTVGIVPLIRTITASSTTRGNNDNRGSATVTVPGLVNSITITINTRGTDPVFWLSDINACVSGTFPTNYHQGANNRPFVGPTQNMPDYFLVTPDNNSTYYVDAATAVARELFIDASKTYVNSFGYDPYNRFLYYISENVSVDANNKQIKKYDYNTESSSVIITDISAAPLNIPTFNSGVESAGCAFYDGALYLGIEGGTQGSGSSLRTRETIIWRIDFDGSNNPVSAYQVFATDASTNGSSSISMHDWGDFIIKNGVIYDFNTARNGSDYSESKYHHYNMQTGNLDALYTNSGSGTWNGQAAMTWAQGLYYFRASTGTNSVIGTYDEAGNNGTPQTITVASGTAWPGGAGDASDPFRPKCDFGDAPASYDPYSNPATQSPAVHERSDNIRLGPTWDYEYLKRGVTGINDVDDGVTFQTVLPPGSGTSFYAFVSAYNNSGSNATLIAWLDYNGNGQFDASEAITPITIPSSPTLQSIGLWWPSTPNTFVNGQTTYMRIRITSASAGMTTSHATGYFTNGEVEDYRVLIDNYPLATQLINFNAAVQNNNKVKLDWKVDQKAGTYAYEIERSDDNNVWSKIYDAFSSGTEGASIYTTLDNNPLKGISYYRLRIKENSGTDRLSSVKRVIVNDFESALTISPNPAKDQMTIQFESAIESSMEVKIISIQGNVLLRKNEKVNTGINKLSIQLPATINSGTYITRITIGNAVINRKIIITR